MNFNINTKTLLGVLVAAGKTLPSKTHVQILTNFLFRVKGDTVTVTASDEEMAVCSVIPNALAVEDGAMCVGATLMIDLLRRMGDMQICVSTAGDGMAVVSHKAGSYRLPTVPVAEYPLREFDVEGAVEFRCLGSQLSHGFDHTSFAVAEENIRPVLTGVYIEADGEGLTFAATDTHILSKYRDTEADPGAECRVILSAKSVKVLRGIIRDDTAVKVTVTDKAVQFASDSFTLQATRVRGNYPDFNRVIPRDYANSCEIDRETLEKCVKRVSVCAPSSGGIMLSLGAGSLTVVAHDSALGLNATERMEAVYQGGPVRMVVEAGQLAEILEAITCPKVRMKFVSPERPLLIQPFENVPSGEMTVIDMPLSIENYAGVEV